jgi:phosphoglycolate phosphatase-like HAD superfamily hydrolase
MLLLFDIDATLVTTGGAGLAAMNETGRRLHGPAFTTDGVDFAGRLDTLIIPELLTRAGVEPTRERLAQFRALYTELLPQSLHARRDAARALPGVLDLLARLRAHPHVALGLVTGNFEQTGRMKLAACGIDPDQFRFCAFGDAAGDGSGPPDTRPTRNDLPPVAIALHRAATGAPADAPVPATIIGDTPHDVRCAKANGCRSLAVATGRFDSAALRHSGADWAVDNLADTEAVERWLLG